MKTTIRLPRTANRARLILATWLCLSALFALFARGAVFSAYERTNTLGANDLFLVASGSNNAYVTRTVTFSNLVGNVAGLTNAAVKFRVGNTKLTLATNSATLQARGGSSVLLGGNLITLLDSNAVPRLEVAANTTAIYAPNGTLAEVITADGTAYFATNVFITNGVLHLGSASLVLSNSPANTVFYEGGVAVIDLRTNSVTIATNLIVTGTLTGNGSGLTNLPQAASSSASSTNLGLTGYVTNGDYSTMIGYGAGSGSSVTQNFAPNSTFIGDNAGRIANPVAWYATDWQTHFSQTTYPTVEAALATGYGWAIAFDPTMDVAAFFTEANIGNPAGTNYDYWGWYYMDIGDSDYDGWRMASKTVGFLVGQHAAIAWTDTTNNLFIVGDEDSPNHYPILPWTVANQNLWNIYWRGPGPARTWNNSDSSPIAKPWQAATWSGVAAALAADYPEKFNGWSPFLPSNVPYTNAIAIGHNARVTAGNTAQIGGIGADAVNLVVNGKGTFTGALTAPNGNFNNLNVVTNLTAGTIGANSTITAGNLVVSSGIIVWGGDVTAPNSTIGALSLSARSIVSSGSPGFSGNGSGITSISPGNITPYTITLGQQSPSPVMSLRYAAMETGLALSLAAPVYVDTMDQWGNRYVQTSVLLVKNTSQSYRAITPPGGAVKASGTWAMTNLSEITTTVYPGYVTNMVCRPIF